MLPLIRSSITTKCPVCIYKSKILPFIEYGNIVLNACTETELAKLQRMQNRCLRVALRRDQLSNVTDSHREELFSLALKILNQYKPVKDIV